MLQEPHQGLPHGAQLHELAEDEKDGLLHAQIRIFLQTLVFRLDVANRCRLDQFATTRFLTARFPPNVAAAGPMPTHSSCP